jgi:hypothetical protein
MSVGAKNLVEGVLLLFHGLRQCVGDVFHEAHRGLEGRSLDTDCDEWVSLKYTGVYGLDFSAASKKLILFGADGGIYPKNDRNASISSYFNSPFRNLTKE